MRPTDISADILQGIADWVTPCADVLSGSDLPSELSVSIYYRPIWSIHNTSALSTDMAGTLFGDFDMESKRQTLLLRVQHNMRDAAIQHIYSPFEPRLQLNI